MKLLKLTIAAAIAGLFIGAGSAAYASFSVVPTYTYTFTANSDAGNTWFDGSTITIQGDSIIAWDLMDNGVPIEESSALDNSHVSSQSISSYDSTTWAGSFTIQNFYAADTFTLDAFRGGSDGTDASNGGYLDDRFTDPSGSWSTQASVPDALNSFQLLALALAAMGASRLFFRNQTPVRVRN